MKKIILIATSLVLFSCTVDSNVSLNQNTGKNQSALPGTTTDKMKDIPVSQVQTIPDTLVITEGNKVKGTANVIYSDNSRNSDIVWSSSDNTIASVNSTTGEISGVKPGVVTILAIAQRDSSKRASITVTVKKADVTEAIAKIVPSEATIKIGETLRLDASIQMSDGSISPNVNWKSDSNSIALVSNGLVTAISEGSTTITAIADGDSTKKASAKITVVKGSTATPTPSASIAPVQSPVPSATPKP